MSNEASELYRQLNRKYVLIVATLSAFLVPFMGSSINIALPTIGIEFTMDAVSLSWVATSFILAAAAFLVPIGRIADIQGRKKVFNWGILIYTVSSLLSAFSNSGEVLISFRVLQRIGSAMIFGPGVAILASAYPPGERGKALGINVAAVYFGLTIGPFIGGILTQNFGWRSIFLINVPLGLIITAIILSKIKVEWIEAKGEKFDFFGSVIYGLILVTLMYGFSILPTTNGLILILVSALGLYTFLKWEMRVKSPILNINLFKKNAVFAFSNLAALINYGATFAVSFLLSLYLQYIKEFDPQNAGLILVAQPLMQAIFSPFAGKLSDRIEPRIIASTGMALITACLSFFIFLSRATPVWLIVCILILLGFSFALFSSPNINAIMSSVEKKFYGVASATLGTMRLIGQMLSMGIAMLVFAIFIGRSQISPENYSFFLISVRYAFLIFTFLCFIGIFASLSRGKLRK